MTRTSSAGLHHRVVQLTGEQLHHRVVQLTGEQMLTTE